MAGLTDLVIPSVRIAVDSPPFRRAGLEFGGSPLIVLATELTGEQMLLLTNEPRLTCEGLRDGDWIVIPPLEGYADTRAWDEMVASLPPVVSDAPLSLEAYETARLSERLSECEAELVKANASRTELQTAFDDRGVELGRAKERVGQLERDLEDVVARVAELEAAADPATPPPPPTPPVTPTPPAPSAPAPLSAPQPARSPKPPKAAD